MKKEPRKMKLKLRLKKNPSKTVKTVKMLKLPRVKIAAWTKQCQLHRKKPERILIGWKGTEYLVNKRM